MNGHKFTRVFNMENFSVYQEKNQQIHRILRSIFTKLTRSWAIREYVYFEMRHAIYFLHFKIDIVNIIKMRPFISSAFHKFLLLHLRETLLSR